MPLESPEQLRAVCQAGKDADPRWYVVHRRWSIYVTWALLHFPVQANHVTAAMMAFGVMGAALLVPRNPLLNVLGFAALYVSFLCDKIDGEVARYRRSSSVRGLLLDRLHHLAIEPLVLLAAAWHDWSASHRLSVWMAGWAMMVLGNLVDEHQHLSAYILFKHVRTVRQRPGRARPIPAAWRRAAAAMRPLKMFRMFITVVPALAACWALESFTGLPAIRTYLYVGVAALAVLLLFQALYYYRHQLEAEIAEQAALLDQNAPVAPTHLRAEIGSAEEQLPRAASRA